MRSKGGGGLTATQDVYLVGIFSLAATALSLWLVKHLSRRTLLVFGHTAMAFAHVMVAVFNLEGINTGVLCMILLFKLIYLNTSGPITWMYAAETTIDAGMGICLGVLWGTVLVLSLVCPIMM